MKMKTFYIETFGCQMNKNDSELISLSMTEHGFIESSVEEEADIIIFNGCSVRENAESRAVSRIRSVKNRKEKIVVAAGCTAQRIGREIIEKRKATIVIGPYQAPETGRIISDYIAKRNSPKEYLSQEIKDFQGRLNPGLANHKRENPWHTWVTITHGCENNCTYCIVPEVRGKLISFPSSVIIDYIKKMAGTGVREITLLGQNVNQYGQDLNDIPFHSLVEKCSLIEGIEKVHFMTSHPKDFSIDIIDTISGNNKISKSIHLPLQSGSNKILTAMNRGYTIEKYLEITAILNKKLDDFSITTDIIIGFPGESNKDFLDTIEAVKKIQFHDAFMFAYSPRSGTPAARIKETLTKEEKQERLGELIDIQREISLATLRNRIGRIEEATAERASRRSAGKLMGKTNLNHPVIFEGLESDIGKNLKIKIHGVKGSSLQGSKIP
jgi:tRNA-2-methylthio-N6-dimethylallyladenosine synthase